jgi:hypothetical protein
MKKGSMVSATLGSFFLFILGVDENNFSNLWLFITISGIFILLP